MGRSASSTRLSSNRCSRPGPPPPAEMNSDTTTSAPNRRHRRRKGDSDTPDMGARKRGKVCPVWYGKCMRHNVMTRCATSNHPLRFAAVRPERLDVRRREFFAEDGINLRLRGTTKDDVLKELVGL